MRSARSIRPTWRRTVRIHSRHAVVEDRVGGHCFQSSIVAQSIAAEALELIEEDALRRGPFGTVRSLSLQDLERHADIESALFTFGLGDHECLKWREVVRQLRHRRRKYSVKLQLGRQEFHRHRQPGRRQNFFLDPNQQILRGHILPQALAERLK